MEAYDAVWIYAVLTLIQTRLMTVYELSRLDICRINSYSNLTFKEEPEMLFGYMPY